MKIKISIGKASVYAILIILTIFALIPFFLTIITSLKSMEEIILRGPLAMPREFVWRNYVRIWSVGNFPAYLKNSIYVTSICIVGVLILSLLWAYTLAYLKFFGKEFIFVLVLLGLMVPVELLIIPLFHNLKAIGLLNTRWAIIFPQIALTIPFGTLLLRGFMKEIPGSLLESAYIDGSTEFKNLVYIIIPLVRPALMTVLIFTGLWSWNNFILPMILIQNDSFRTMPVGLNFFQSRYEIDFAMITTAANVSALPTVLIYLIFQKKFIRGMTMGALKE